MAFNVMELLTGIAAVYKVPAVSLGAVPPKVFRMLAPEVVVDIAAHNRPARIGPAIGYADLDHTRNASGWS
jgi:hypothetical protein